jgi:hypothetical protein
MRVDINEPRSEGQTVRIPGFGSMAREHWSQNANSAVANGDIHSFGLGSASVDYLRITNVQIAIDHAVSVRI